MGPGCSGIFGGDPRVPGSESLLPASCPPSLADLESKEAQYHFLVYKIKDTYLQSNGRQSAST